MISKVRRGIAGLFLKAGRTPISGSNVHSSERLRTVYIERYECITNLLPSFCFDWCENWRIDNTTSQNKTLEAVRYHIVHAEVITSRLASSSSLLVLYVPVQVSILVRKSTRVEIATRRCKL